MFRTAGRDTILVCLEYETLDCDVGSDNSINYIDEYCEYTKADKFLSPTNAPLYYTYKMLKYTVKISHDCSYMFRSIWTIIREPMP